MKTPLVSGFLSHQSYRVAFSAINPSVHRMTNFPVMHATRNVSFFPLLQTPVYLATVTNQPAIVKHLISFNADVNIQAHTHHANNERKHLGPLHFAAERGRRFQCLQALVAAPGLDIDRVNSEGTFPHVYLTLCFPHLLCSVHWAMTEKPGAVLLSPQWCPPMPYASW